MANELIAVKQLPIIEERLKDLAADIDRQVEEALALTVTVDTVKTVKEVRAGLNKQFRELEDQRKAVKKAILEPYEQFDQIYKKYVAVRFDEADAELKRKINDVEFGLKKKKEDELRSYFREYAESVSLDWVTFETGNFNITLSKSMKALKEEVSQFLDRISEETRVITGLPNSAEVMAEYKKFLRFDRAIEVVDERNRAIEREQEEQERRLTAKKEEEERVKEVQETAEKFVEAPEIEPEEEPEQEDDPVMTLAFTVSAPLSKLKELKRFLTEGGYEID